MAITRYNNRYATILEKRITRLEKLIKNEAKLSDKSDFLKGSIVEDLNGDESVVIDMGTFRAMYNKWYNRLMPDSQEAIDDYLIELGDEDWVNTAFTVVTRFDEDGAISMSTDPENELEVVGGVGSDYEFESRRRPFISRYGRK